VALSNSIHSLVSFLPAIPQVHAILEREIAAGTPSENIIVGGFSQGGCLALRAALSFPKVRGGGLTRTHSATLRKPDCLSSA
jgi:predicted esterase